jgi:hypothetical protein
MSEPSDPAIPTMPEVSPALAELTDEITRQLQAGESVDTETYAALHPDCAEPIRALLPTMQDLVKLGQIVARERLDSPPLAEGSGHANGRRSLP